MSRLWNELIAGYQYVAYWTPPVWLLLWWSRKEHSLEGVPWWIYPLSALVNVLAIGCTIRLHRKGVEPNPPTLS